MKKVQDKKQIEIRETLEFAEIVSELGDGIVRYHAEDILERFKTGIIPNCFENIEEYNEFVYLLSEFVKYYEIMLQENRSGKPNASGSQKKTMDFIKTIKTKYPKQFEQLLLLQVLIEGNHPFIIEASLKYLKGRNVYVERLTQDSMGYKYLEVASTAEIDENFLKKEISERGEYEIGLRKYTKEETELLRNAKIASIIEYLTPADFAYCAKKPEYANALFFNMFSYVEFSKDRPREESFNSLAILFYKNIQYLNISKLKTLLLHRVMQYTEFLETDAEFEYQEMIVRELLEIIKSSKNVNIKMSGFSISIPNLYEINFEPHDKRKNVINDFPPIQVITSDSDLERTTIDIDGTSDVSTRETIENAEKFLLSRRIEKFLEQYKRNELSDTSINFKQQSNLVALKEGLKQKLRNANPNLSDKEIEDMYFLECQKLITFLCNQNLMDLQLAKRFDELVTAELVSNGTFVVQDKDLARIGFSKESIVYIGIKSPERMISYIKLGLISTSDILKCDNITNDCVQILFNTGNITVNDLMELITKKKLTATSLKGLKVSNVIDLEKQIDSEKLSELYIEINRKRIEYETESKISYDKAIAEGIEDDEITPTQRELELQEELQILIDKKNAYIYLVNLLNLKDKERKSFCESVFLGPIEKVSDTDFVHIVEEMYKDGMVSMDQINDLDSGLFIKLMKSGIILSEDIKKFKELAVLDEEKEKIRQSADSEEKFNEEVEILRYKKLHDIVASIVQDTSLSDEEKIGIIYSIYTLNTSIESFFREEYTQSIFAGKIDSTYDFFREEFERKTVSRKKIKTDRSTSNHETSSQKSDTYLYYEYAIWEFMRVLDPKVQIDVYRDGYASFSSRKLDKVILEKVWKGDGKSLEREYGVSTISMDFDTFENNKARIVQYRRDGYRINVVNAKELLPVIRINDKEKRVGIIRHAKDLKHSGRKNWFDYLLDNFGINLDDIRQGKDSRYTVQDADTIEATLLNIRNSYERM